MKVLLVANYPPDRQESMLRFANMLNSGLQDRGVEVRVVQPGVVLGGLVGSRSGLRKWLAYVDKLVLFHRKLCKLASWADVVHICDHSNAVYAGSLASSPLVVTCHDMLAVRSALGELGEKSTGWSGRLYQKMILSGLDKTPAIVCVSHSTMADVRRLVKCDEKIVRVVPNGLNYAYHPMEKSEAVRHLATLGLQGVGDFLLHVGGNHWYKNRLGVLRIFHEACRRHEFPALSLVLAGEPASADMNEYIHRHDLSRSVHIVTGADNEQLRALYSSARALLFPSLYEGFGWPIIEAHACGCPVITSNRPPMSEVGGEAAILVSPDNISDAADRVAVALEKGEGGGADAIANAEKYTSSAMVEGYISVYRTVWKGSVHDT